MKDLLDPKSKLRQKTDEAAHEYSKTHLTQNEVNAIIKWVNSKTISAQAVEFVHSAEGDFEPNIYDADKEHKPIFNKEGMLTNNADWTIGYGHKITAIEIKNKTFSSDGITQKQALDIYRKDNKEFTDNINKLLNDPGKVTQNQFDALVSFSFQQGMYNETTKYAVKLINDGKVQEAAEYIKNYGDKTSRREGEYEMMMNSIYLPPSYYENKNFYSAVLKSDYERLKIPIKW